MRASEGELRHAGCLKEAAARLDQHPVDTIRMRPEEAAVAYFADIIESCCIDLVSWPKRDDYRIETAIKAIEQLNAAEYGEMTGGHVRSMRGLYEGRGSKD